MIPPLFKIYLTQKSFYDGEYYTIKGPISRTIFKTSKAEWKTP